LSREGWTHLKTIGSEDLKMDGIAVLRLNVVPVKDSGHQGKQFVDAWMMRALDEGVDF
jgi:hypothetical protein